mgnify:FL=1|jgi:hypothetical protein|tara:strand:+ start:1948 stop:2505 length:558 start_codon:yes stop_codon:yes gene_type:complete
MPWKHNGKTITIGKAWVADDGTQHPSVWMRWSESEKKANGLTWEDPPKSEAPFDKRFYSGRKTDGTLIEKNLVDEDAKDLDGNQLYEEDGKTKRINEGLKTVWIRKIKEMTNSRLSSSDWMITRKSEKGTAIPDATTTYRDSVRTACNTIETKINDCSSFADFMKLFDAPSDGGNPPIYDFPDEI